MTKVSWRGREIHNPAIRFFAVVIALPIGVVVAVVGMLIWLPLIMLSVPLHFVLIALGRRGFSSRSAGGGTNYIVKLDGFRKA